MTKFKFPHFFRTKKWESPNFQAVSEYFRIISIGIPNSIRNLLLRVNCFTSVRPSVRPKICFVAFFSATIDGRNLIFGHKLHIDIPYGGKRFWVRQIPTSCLPA